MSPPIDPERIDRILENVERLQSQGAHDTAIHLLRSALAEDPDHALAHALLAASLLQKKRLHAADAEARLALTLDPELPAAHFALAAVCVARRLFDEARTHLDAARALAPDAAGPLITMARLAVINDDRVGARTYLEEARALEPDDVGVVVALGDLALLERKLDEAAQLAREALELDPDGVSSHLLAGQVALVRGDDEAAREHARMALRVDPTDSDALALLAGVRAKQSLVLGLWWRWHASVAHLGESHQVLVLIGLFVAVRLLVIFLRVSGRPEWANIAENLWLACCVYTWVGPSLFKRAVEKELAGVTLKRDY